ARARSPRWQAVYRLPRVDGRADGGRCLERGRRGGPRGDERPGVTGGRAGGSRVRIVFLGSGAFGIEPLWRLDQHPDVELVGVVTSPPRSAGRKQLLTSTVIEQHARELAV